MHGHKSSHLPIRYFLALLWAHPILHISRIRVKFYYARVLVWSLECSAASCCFFPYVALNQAFSPLYGQLQLRHSELAYTASPPSWGARLGWTCAASQGKEICSNQVAQRLAWFGHVHRMPDDSMVKRVYEWSPALTRSLGRPKNRWEDDVKNDVANLRITSWKDCVSNRSKWKEFVEKAKTSPKL